MSTLSRTYRNFRKIGFKEYWRQLNRTLGDTKAGTLIGKDRFGNKYYENLEELPCQHIPSFARLHLMLKSEEHR